MNSSAQSELVQHLVQLEDDLRNDRFDAARAQLGFLDADELSPATLVGILTITSFARVELGDARTRFFLRAEERLRRALGEERAEELLRNRR